MKELIEKFSEQLKEALAIGRTAKLNLGAQTYSQVVINGLGGSGIGASILSDYVKDKLSIPLLVNKTYDIPKHVGAHTLFIACSYSGNTEETIAAYRSAKAKKATVVCVTSGGELLQLAIKHKQPYIQIPAGNPPRASLGYSMVQLLYILYYAKLISLSSEREILSAIQMLETSTKQIQKKAFALTQTLKNQFIAIYANDGYEGLAVRFRQQLNENSKVLAWHNIVPEMTHNEIVGWRQSHPNVHVLFCYHKEDYPRNMARLQYLKKVLKSYKANLSDIELKGDNYWQKAFYFIHLTDWISVYLADINQQDAGEVKVIDGLKKMMATK